MAARIASWIDPGRIISALFVPGFFFLEESPPGSLGSLSETAGSLPGSSPWMIEDDTGLY